MSMQNNGVSRRDILAGAAAAAIAVSPLAANAEVEYPNVPFRESRRQTPVEASRSSRSPQGMPQDFAPPPDSGWHRHGCLEYAVTDWQWRHRRGVGTRSFSRGGAGC